MLTLACLVRASHPPLVDVAVSSDGADEMGATRARASVQVTRDLFYKRGVPYNARDWRDADALAPEHLCGARAAPAYDACAAGWAEWQSPPSAASAWPSFVGVGLLEFLAAREPLELRLRGEEARGRGLLAGTVDVPHASGPVELTSSRGNAWLQSAAALEHGAEQLEHLVARGRLPRAFLELAGAYRATVEGMARVVAGHALFVPDRRFFKAQHFLFNTLVYLPPPPPPPPARAPWALGRGVAWRAVEDRFLAGEIVVVDDALSPWALEAARAFCLEATVFFEPKDGRYLGAYYDDGFQSDAFARITEELRRALPRVVGDLPLRDFWAYKYANDASAGRVGDEAEPPSPLLRYANDASAAAAQSGVGIHSDAAKVNLNVWLTPTAANLDPASGGMVVWNYSVTTEEAFHAFQGAGASSEASEGRLLAAAGSVPARVAFRQNRMVLFDSSRVHATEPLRFARGYANRRINLTWLFGDPPWTWRRPRGSIPW